MEWLEELNTRDCGIRRIPGVNNLKLSIVVTCCVSMCILMVEWASMDRGTESWSWTSWQYKQEDISPSNKATSLIVTFDQSRGRP